MNHEIHLDLDPASDQFKELQDAYLNDKTYTIERDGVIYTGCRIKSVRLEGPGNDVRGYVTLMAHHEQDYSELEARTLAWLDANQRFGGDPFDPDAKSFYDADKMRKRLSITERYGRIPDDRIPKGVNVYGRRGGMSAGAHYSHKMEYAKGGPWAWTRPGVGFYPHEKFRFEELEMKNWKFKSVHPKDIDFEELGESVTRRNPLALVRGSYTTTEKRYRPLRTKEGYIVHTDGTVRNDKNELILSHTPPSAKLDELALPQVESYTAHAQIDENYVVIHKSILDKAMACAICRPMTVTWKATISGGRICKGVPTKDLAKWVKWAKDVKAAKWGGEERRKVTFEVDLVSV